MNSYAKAETLVGAFAAPLDWTRSALLVVGFSLLTALAAQVVVPLPWTPVPLTGQTFAVLLTGALLGPRLGALAMLAYLAEGAAGLPFFRGGGGGLGHLSAATAGGYLLAFPAAAYVTGVLAERGWDRRFLTAAAAMFLGSLVILAGGWAWFSLAVGVEQAFWRGVLPFLPGDVVKIAFAAALLPAGWALLRKTGSRGE